MHSQSLPTELLAIVVAPLLTVLGGSDDSDEDEHEGRSQVGWLRSLGDREALFQIMDANRQLTQGLDAAEALAELGDVRGLDHLIAALNGPSSYLRHQAAQILKRLNHPRGLRALADRSEEPGGSSRGVRREQLYEDLNSRKTDDLVATWHEHDRSQWSDIAFEVMEAILTERLGKLPPRDDEAGRGSRDNIDENVDPRIGEMWSSGDVQGLIRFFYAESDAFVQLEAAEALADLGDQDALDLLIEALDDADPKVSEMAAGILDWLDLPRGNEALEDRGFEFETGAQDLLEEPEAQARDEPSNTDLPSATRDSWVARPRTPPLIPGIPTSTSAAQSAWQQQDTGSGVSPAILLTGAIGGLLGYMIFRLGLHYFGWLALPQNPAGWLQASALGYLGAAVIVGASVGGFGSRLFRALGTRLGWESGEGDPVPVLGALFEGATSAVIADLMLFYLIGS